jgi:hypothetical protein
MVPISLKTEMNMMGMSMRIVATAVDTGAVDDAVFLHPAGIVAQSDPESDDSGAEHGPAGDGRCSATRTAPGRPWCPAMEMPESAG